MSSPRFHRNGLSGEARCAGCGGGDGDSDDCLGGGGGGLDGGLDVASSAASDNEGFEAAASFAVTAELVVTAVSLSEFGVSFSAAAASESSFSSDDVGDSGPLTRVSATPSPSASLCSSVGNASATSTSGGVSATAAGEDVEQPAPIAEEVLRWDVCGE